MFRGKGVSSPCRKVRGMLSEYIDNRLDGEKKTLVEHHLQTCEACSKELESLQMTLLLLHRVPEVPVPRSFTVTAPQPKRESVFGPRGLRWLRPVTAVAAIALMVLIAGDFSHAFVNNAGVNNEGNVTYVQWVPSTPTEQQTMVAVPGVMGRMSLATAKAVGYTNYTLLPPTPPALDESHTMVSIPGVMGQMTLATAKALGYTDYNILTTSPPEPTTRTDSGTVGNEGPAGPSVPAGPSGAGFTPEKEVGVGWPLRQTEIGLGAVVVVLLGLMVFARRQRKARVTVN